MDNAGNFTYLNIIDILPNRFQPRIHFDDHNLNELAESIRKYGVIQPIVVRQIGNKYEIIAGERRYKASKIANKSTIPAIVITLNDKESEEIALLENVQRQNLTPIEEAVSYKRILDMGYITQDELAKKIGKSQSTIANKIRLLNLDDEVQYALLNGKISERHARSLLRIHDKQEQVKMLNRIITERLTVKRTDDAINDLLSTLAEENSPFQKKESNVQMESNVNNTVESLTISDNKKIEVPSKSIDSVEPHLHEIKIQEPTPIEPTPMPFLEPTPIITESTPESIENLFVEPTKKSESTANLDMIKEKSNFNQIPKTNNNSIEELFVTPNPKPKPRRAVAVASHEIIRVNPPKELEQKLKRKEEGFMDIDKIMQEAQDINVEKPNKDISSLMRQDNVAVNPTPEVVQNSESISLQQTAPENNDIPLVNDDQNKFVNFAGINQEQQVTPQSPLLQQNSTNSGVSFDSMFNQTPANLNGNDTPTTSNLESISNAQPVQTPTQVQSNQNDFNLNQTIPEPADSTSIPEVPIDESKPVQNQEPVSIATAVQRAMNTEPPVGPSISENIEQPIDNSNPNVGSPQESDNNQTLYNELIQSEPSMSEPLSAPAPQISTENIQVPEQIPVQEVPIPDQANIPNMDIIGDNPTIDSEVQEPVQMQPANNFTQVIQLIRNCSDQIEKMGYYIDLDEVDLGNQYQVTFKINKQ